MTQSNRYVLHERKRVLLRNLYGASIRLLEAGTFDPSPKGTQGMGLLAEMRRKDGLTAVVYGEPAKGTFGTYPSIHVDNAHDYSGDWVAEIPQSRSLRACLEATGIFGVDPTVLDVHVIQDVITWISGRDGTPTSVSTELGFQIHLSNGAWLLVLARDSDCGILQFVYTSLKEELNWWFSAAGVAHNWIFDGGPDSLDTVLTAHRSLGAV